METTFFLKLLFVISRLLRGIPLVGDIIRGVAVYSPLMPIKWNAVHAELVNPIQVKCNLLIL